MRLAVIISHPIQYYAPIFRALAQHCDLHVFHAQKLVPEQHSSSGFGVSFEWDVDLITGYESSFLRNVSKSPAPDRFWGADTPEIGARLRAEGFDALLVVGWYLKSFVQAIWSAKRLGIPVLVRGDSHLGTPRSSIKRAAKALMFPPFLRAFDAALYVGTHSRAYFRHYNFPERRMFFSPHCVDTSWFAERATPEARHRLRASLEVAPDTTLLLFAGKLVPFKRPLDVIEAAAKCRSEGIKAEVLVAGSGQLDLPMREKAAKSGVPLHLLGFCNQTAMPEAYAAADLLILPSDGRETWGLVANEALACGRPIVVSEACGCAPDLAGDGKAGRVAPLGDIAGLAAAIGDLLARPSQAGDVLERSRSYSVEAAAGGILAAASAVSKQNKPFPRQLERA